MTNSYYILCKLWLIVLALKWYTCGSRGWFRTLPVKQMFLFISKSVYLTITSGTLFVRNIFQKHSRFIKWICFIYNLVHMKHGKNLFSNIATYLRIWRNFHVLAPKRYKRSVLQGFDVITYRACGSWESFHGILTKAKGIFERNHYPSGFYDPHYLFSNWKDYNIW